jgi:FimV-like protein
MTVKQRLSTLVVALGLIAGSTTASAATVADGSAPTAVWQVLAWQGQQMSRWQDDQFGPIVSTDTMWTIATYYGRQQGLTVYAMMDAIVAANPRVFIDNRPDRMMSGYRLVIPAVGPLVTQAPQPQPQHTVQFKAEELRDLRDRLADSITMIEQLQNDNALLQARLNDVTAELAALKSQLASDRAIDQEIDALAGELVEQTPVSEGQQQALVEAPLVSQPASVDSSRRGTDGSGWLVQPPQLYLLIALPLLLLLLSWGAYQRRLKRRIEREFSEQTGAANSTAAVSEQPLAPVTVAAAEQVVAAEPLAEQPSTELATDEIIDGEQYVSIDALLNDADNAEQHRLADGYDAAEFDLSSDDSNSPAAQLDLAQAYIDMGEVDDARALLQRIIAADDAEAEREALLLLQQLDGQSGR